MGKVQPEASTERWHPNIKPWPLRITDHKYYNRVSALLYVFVRRCVWGRMKKVGWSKTTFPALKEVKTIIGKTKRPFYNLEWSFHCVTRHWFDSVNLRETADLVWNACEGSLSASIWKTRSCINAPVQTLSIPTPHPLYPPPQCTPCTGSQGLGVENGVLGPDNHAASDCFITGPFIDLVCTELMNWGSGQEHIIGRNEFLSQPSREATGPGCMEPTEAMAEWEGGGRIQARSWARCEIYWEHEWAVGCWIGIQRERPWIHRDIFVDSLF